MVAVQTPSATESDPLVRGAIWPSSPALTVALRLPAYLASAHLTFDDGVFGASAVAMRAGGQPYRDVFSSQGPLFLPLVWVADLLGFRTANAPRLLSLAAALAPRGRHLRRRPGDHRPRRRAPRRRAGERHDDVALDHRARSPPTARRWPSPPRRWRWSCGGATR